MKNNLSPIQKSLKQIFSKYRELVFTVDDLRKHLHEMGWLEGALTEENIRLNVSYLSSLGIVAAQPPLHLTRAGKRHKRTKPNRPRR